MMGAYSPRRPPQNAADRNRHEPANSRPSSRADLPADSKIREGHQPDRREPAAADWQNSGGPGSLLLRGCPGGKASRRDLDDKPAARIPRHARWTGPDRVVRKNPERQAAPKHYRSGRTARGDREETAEGETELKRD